MIGSTRLSHEQKEAVGLLQIGTFLEYFDLMLYIHMAVLLNELFFPKTDHRTAALLSAIAFCSTYLYFLWLSSLLLPCLYPLREHHQT